MRCGYDFQCWIIVGWPCVAFGKVISWIAWFCLRGGGLKKALLLGKAFKCVCMHLHAVWFFTSVLFTSPQLTAQNFADVGFREVVSKDDVFGRFIAR